MMHVLTRIVTYKYSIYFIFLSQNISILYCSQATAALTCLYRIHELKKKGPIPNSLVLSHLLHIYNPDLEKKGFFAGTVSRIKLWKYLKAVSLSIYFDFKSVLLKIFILNQFMFSVSLMFIFQNYFNILYVYNESFIFCYIGNNVI